MRSDRQKKITLITGTLSGSNTAILYKLMPEYIRSKFEVELIGERPFHKYSDDTRKSNVVVTTHANYPFNPNQINVELWHGFPLKGMANMDYTDPRSPKEVLQTWEHVDFIASYSPLFNTLFNACVGAKISKYNITGAPRNDMLFKSNGIKNLERLLGKSFERKKNIIFYLPTFRKIFFNPNKNDGDRHWNNIFGFDHFDYDKFQRFLSENQIELLIKLHPVEEPIVMPLIQRMGLEGVSIIPSALFDENGTDLYEILNSSHLMVTDYSSVFFDYLLLDRPIVFVPTDLKQYKKSRGFLLEPYELWTPGSKVFDQNAFQTEVIKCLQDPEYYKTERARIRDLIHFYQDDRSSDRVWKNIDELLETNNPSHFSGISHLQKNEEQLKEEIKTTISSLIENGHVSEALQSIQLYKKEIGIDADILCFEGIIAFIENNYAEAIEFFDKAVALNREHSDSIFNLAVVYCKERNYEMANFYLQRAITRFPDLVESELAQNIFGEIVGNINNNGSKKRILIGSPVHQKPEILNMFLTSLNHLNKEEYDVSFLFVDDNIEPESSELLRRFQLKNRAYIIKSYSNDQYIRNEVTHVWNEKLIWKVAGFKNDIIDFCKFNHYDYLFLLDSDLVLHPHTLNQLVAAEKEIISNIFWTKWDTNSIELPQVWVKDFYTLYESSRNEKLDKVEINKRTLEFLNMLREPGIYKVGGLGACTLISRSAIDKGVSFSEINNVSFWGEDRHFCIRAAAMGIDLYVDTHYPAFHIYRESDLQHVNSYMASCGYNL